MKNALILCALVCSIAANAQTLKEFKKDVKGSDVPEENLHHYQKIFGNYSVDSVVTYSESFRPVADGSVSHKSNEFIETYFSLTQDGFQFYYKYTNPKNPYTTIKDKGSFVASTRQEDFISGYDEFKIDFVGDFGSYDARLLYMENNVTKLEFYSTDGRNAYWTSYYLRKL